METKKIRYSSIELMRIITAFSVVYIHFDVPGKIGWLLHILSFYAVHFFFTVSGYFVIGDTKADNEILQQKILKNLKKFLKFLYMLLLCMLSLMLCGLCFSIKVFLKYCCEREHFSVLFSLMYGRLKYAVLYGICTLLFTLTPYYILCAAKI